MVSPLCSIFKKQNYKKKISDWWKMGVTTGKMSSEGTNFSLDNK